MCTLRVRDRFLTTTLICVHPSTEDSNDDTKDAVKIGDMNKIIG